MPVVTTAHFNGTVEADRCPGASARQPRVGYRLVRLRGPDPSPGSLQSGSSKDLTREGLRPGKGPEGFCGDFQIALPYRGLFVWHVGHDDVVGDSNQVRVRPERRAFSHERDSRRLCRADHHTQSRGSLRDSRTARARRWSSTRSSVSGRVARSHICRAFAHGSCTGHTTGSDGEDLGSGGVGAGAAAIEPSAGSAARGREWRSDGAARPPDEGVSRSEPVAPPAARRRRARGKRLPGCTSRTCSAASKACRCTST